MAGIVVRARALTRTSTQNKANALDLASQIGYILRQKADAIVRDMQVYPPEVPGTQRTPVKGKRGDGTRKSYQRTYKLRDGWKHDQPHSVSGDFVTVIENHAIDTKRNTPKEYASYVEGPRTGDYHQVWYHGAHGWANIDTVHQKYGQELAQEVRELIREEYNLNNIRTGRS